MESVKNVAIGIPLFTLKSQFFTNESYKSLYSLNLWLYALRKEIEDYIRSASSPILDREDQ